MTALPQALSRPDSVYTVTPAQKKEFDENGFIMLRGVFHLERDIIPIQRGIQRIWRMVGEQHGLKVPNTPFHTDTFDEGYLEMVENAPELHAEVYNAIKCLLPFVRLSAHATLESILGSLRGSDFVGAAMNGSGIRIDRPHNTVHSLPWHQDFPFQFRSLDGITFWSPLAPVVKEMGPLELCKGSHKLGPMPLVDLGAGDDELKMGVYSSLRIFDEDKITSNYEVVAPTCEPGDLLVLDFQTIHRSGPNVGKRPRWSAQIRQFNFLEPMGRELGWPGSFKTGKSYAEINALLDRIRAGQK